MIRESINRIDIKSLKKSAQEIPTFIFIMAGTGAGKNYVFNKYLKGLNLIDIDEYTAEFAKQYGSDPRKQVSRATARSKRELLASFEQNKTVVQMGTGNNVNSSLNKFKWAKDAGMRVVVLLVDVDSKSALKRNKDRHAGGEQRLVPDEKVVRTVEVARKNFELYKNDSNVDETIKYKN